MLEFDHTSGGQTQARSFIGKFIGYFLVLAVVQLSKLRPRRLKPPRSYQVSLGLKFIQSWPITLIDHQHSQSAKQTATEDTSSAAKR